MRMDRILVAAMMAGALLLSGCKKNVTEEQKREASRLNVEGLRYYQTKNLPSALGKFVKAAEIDPGNPEYPNNAGMCKLQLGGFAEAHEYFQKALDVKEMAIYHVNDGMALAGLGKTDDALKAFAAAIKIEPGSYTAHFQSGVLLFQNRKFSEAAEAWKQACAIEAKAECQVNIGLAFMEMGKLDEAEAHIRKGRDTNPKYYMAHYNLGVLLQKQGKPADAAELYKKTADLEPNYYPAYYNLGLVYKQQGKKTEARAALEKYLQLLPASMRDKAEDARRQLQDLK